MSKCQNAFTSTKMKLRSLDALISASVPCGLHAKFMNKMPLRGLRAVNDTNLDLQIKVYFA